MRRRTYGGELGGPLLAQRHLRAYVAVGSGRQHLEPMLGLHALGVESV